jgi:NTP pyrophosphatase (non-canonical NTP hydrolase)
MGYGNKSIDDWVDDVHALANAKGWWNGIDEPSADQILAKLMLVNTELAEAAERVRAPDFKPKEFFLTRGAIGHPGKPDGFGVEIADAVIRLMDLCGKLGFSLEKCIREKFYYNETRPERHGGKRA